MTTTASEHFDDVFGPTVAGRFYPGDPTALRRDVESYLKEAHDAEAAIPDDRRTVALVAPHAGYAYSGAVAAVAYASVRNNDVRTVVILSPSHHGRAPHACLLDADAYRTPLGTTALDRDVVRKLDDQGKELIETDEKLFAPEHAADVHVPFVQTAFPNARVVPVIVPMASRSRLETLGNMLYDVVGSDPRALVVASSDLSHFFDYDRARSIDEAILGEIERGEVEAVLAKHDQRRGPCGVAPIVVALSYLRGFGDDGKVQRLKLLNSGDVRPGNRGRVVGYAAMALTVPDG